MAQVVPLAAIRFDHTRTGGDLSALLAPPYDVLDQQDKDALLARSEHNIVAVDLPHVPPKSAGPDKVYQRSAKLLEQWLTEGILVREKKPALYLYHQRFDHAGQPYTRRMFIARVRLQAFSEGVILPHEKTFGGPKEDRLALMKATKCQLSPIFGLYADQQDRIGQAFAATSAGKPDATGQLDGVESRVWIVTDADLITTVTAAMADKKLYIADGHHRYGTALLYRDELAKQHGGALPANHPANFIMFILAGMDDPGCLILPYYRAVANVSVDSLIQAWSEGVAPAASADQADIVLHDGRTGDQKPLRFTNRDALKALEPSECEAWYQLDYAYLHRYLLDELYSRKIGAPKMHYVKSIEDAKQIARDESGVALLVKATPMAHLRAVSEQGGLMPQKSTYFHPKLATGVALNPLA